MKFKVDENLPEDLCDVLRNAGWDCRSVVEQQLGGQDDTRITQVCELEQRICQSFGTQNSVHETTILPVG